MPSHSSSHHSRYDDPYVFDDPYRHSTSPIKSAAYEYVGTDEPSIHSKSRHTSPDPGSHRRSSPSRQYSRATSPPRHSRHDRTHSPVRPDRRSPVPRSSRRNSPSPRPSRNAPQTRHHQDQDPSQRPGVKRSKSFGERGLKFLSEAAALYAATQAGKDDRGRSQSRDRPHRSSHHDSEPKHSHHRRSPTPSPSPSRRRSRAYSDDPPRRHRRHRSSQSDDSDYDHDRGRRHRHSRANSYRPSPSRSPSRHRGRHTKSASSSFRSTRQEGPSRAPDKEVADRWQAAARAALEAGGLAAFRLRKEPGSWTGEKGAKVATAALGAAAIDAFMDKDPRRVKSGGVKGFAENAISGLIASKIIGGKSPSKRRGKH